MKLIVNPNLCCDIFGVIKTLKFLRDVGVLKWDTKIHTFLTKNV